MACVINGDTVSGVLRQATWLVVEVIVPIVAQAIAGPRVKPVGVPDTNG